MPTITLHSNENSQLDIIKPLEEHETLLGRFARLIHRELTLQLKNSDIKPNATAVIAVGATLYFATENPVNKMIIQKMISALSERIDDYASRGTEELTDYIDEKTDKYFTSIESFTNDNVYREYNLRWRSKRRYDGSACTIEDVYKHFERKIASIQGDIDIAVVARYFIDQEATIEKQLVAMLNNQSIAYVENEKVHGQAAKSFNIHPEITLISYVKQFSQQLLPQLPRANKDGLEIPYLYVAASIKCCKKCHTLLNGNSETNFKGFNGAYATRNSPKFIVFNYGHYESGYPN